MGKHPAQQSTRFLSPSRLIFYVLALGVFFIGLKYVNTLHRISELLLGLRPAYLLLVLLLQLATYACNALVVQSLLGEQKVKMRFALLLKLSVVVLFINQTLPTGGISGYSYLFRVLTQKKITEGQAFRVVILESLSYYAAILSLLALACLWWQRSRGAIPEAARYTALVGYLFFFGLAALVVTVSNRKLLAALYQRLRGYRRLKGYLSRYLASLLPPKREAVNTSLLAQPEMLLRAALFQTVQLVCDTLTVMALLTAFGVRLPLGEVLLAMVLTMVVGSLPITPGALIAYESAMTYFLTLFGAPVHAALVVTLLYRFLTFWLPVPVGLILYRNLEDHAGQPQNQPAP